MDNDHKLEMRVAPRCWLVTSDVLFPSLSMGFSKISCALFECGLMEVACLWLLVSQLESQGWCSVAGDVSAQVSRSSIKVSSPYDIPSECSTEVCSPHGLSISLFQISTMIIRKIPRARERKTTTKQPSNQPSNQATN